MSSAEHVTPVKVEKKEEVVVDSEKPMTVAESDSQQADKVSNVQVHQSKRRHKDWKDQLPTREEVQEDFHNVMVKLEAVEKEAKAARSESCNIKTLVIQFKRSIEESNAAIKTQLNSVTDQLVAISQNLNQVSRSRGETSIARIEGSLRELNTKVEDIRSRALANILPGSDQSQGQNNVGVGAQRAEVKEKLSRTQARRKRHNAKKTRLAENQADSEESPKRPKKDLHPNFKPNSNSNKVPLGDERKIPGVLGVNQGFNIQRPVDTQNAVVSQCLLCLGSHDPIDCAFVPDRLDAIRQVRRMNFCEVCLLHVATNGPCLHRDKVRCRECGNNHSTLFHNEFI